ncbi:FAD binding domain containing protein [Rhypophila decipiens]
MARLTFVSLFAAVLVPNGLGQLLTGQTGENIKNPDLLDFERLQLTDKVISNLQSQKQFQKELKLVSFGDYTQPQNNPNKENDSSKKCKIYPGDKDWPSDKTWSLFNYLLGNGALIKTIPEAAICYADWANETTYSPSKCEAMSTTWNNSTLRGEDPTSIRSVLFQGMTCMPPNYTALFLGNTVGSCTVGGFPSYSINVSSVAQVQLAVNIARELDLRLVIKNTGHDFGGKSTGMGGLSLWTHYMKDWRFYEKYQAVDGSYSGPAFRLGAGIQAFEAFELAKAKNVTVVGGEGKTVGMIGGYIQGGGHSPLTSIYGMAADHVLSMNLVTADGRFITADSKTNSDIFWAVRGGGGSTFGVVTSMVVRAFPQMKVTIMTYNMTTSSTFPPSTFWEAQRAYVDNFEEYADKGFYAYYRIRHVNGQIYHDMNAMVAPNTSESEFRATLAPLFKKWQELGVPPFIPFIKEYDNYHDAWKDGFPQEVWTWAMRQASRLIPRENISNSTKRVEIFDSIKGVFDKGANLIIFNIRNPPGTDKIDNAVNPAWRDVLMFAIMFVTWQVGDSAEYVTQLNRNLTYEWNPRWKALTPGGGTYMSESDYIEPNWQESFHGWKYKRLLEIKKTVDPWDVFYATNAVGSEEWELEGTLLGHLPSQNSRLCRK